MPIMVRPAVSKLMVQTTGRPVARAPVGHLLEGVHGLYPQHVGAALGQRLGLFGIGGGALGHGQLAERHVHLAGRTHGAADHDIAAGFRDHLAGQARGGRVELGHPLGCAVQLQAVAGAAEGVGQNDVRAGVDEGAVLAAHLVGLVDVPQLGRVTGGQPGREEVGPGGAVGEQPGPLGEHLLEQV
jgi:hypothetical protein